MSPLMLTMASIMSLATNPSCGGAKPGSDLADRLVAIALYEGGDRQSFADPLIIGVNADPSRGLPAASIQSMTSQEAAARAHVLLGQGRRIDLGLMQISDRQLARHGLTVERAFDACQNMRAGAEHYRADVQTAFRLGHQIYNTGGTERGAAYAAGVEQVLARVRNPAIQIAGTVSIPPAIAPAPILPPAEPINPFMRPGGGRVLIFTHANTRTTP